MKKIILLLAFVSVFGAAFAQFDINPRLAKNQATSNKFLIEAKAIFTNTGNDSVFEWEVIEVTIPSGWNFGMCDPLNCLETVNVGRKSSFTMGKGKGGEFKGDFSANSIAGTGSAKVIIYPKNNPSLADTLTYVVNAWPVSVRENVRASNEFSIFPNPAKDHLAIRYSSKEPISISIYNILGVRVKTVVHTGFETEINLGDLQNGIYFIRFKDGNTTISKSFTKNE